MDILELEQYNLQDAVELHDELNPKLFDGEQLRPEVRDALLRIADDFAESLGIKDLDIEDITFSGSNAAYAYTPHSDIDLHLVVNMPKDGDVYKELFNAKKYQYNDSHNITVRGYDVELYVQPAEDAHHSAGIYSLKQDDWVKIPVRRKIKINDRNVRNKYETLKAQIDSAVASKNHAKIERLQHKIKKMRQSGLDKSGEFGAENLAFKMLRTQGLIKKLIDARQAAKSRDLSIDEANRDKAKFINGFSEEISEGASGYIPSSAEKNDPRFSNALTVDVGPDAIKKNAKKLGFNTSRAGIPPKLRSDGKIKESKKLTESAVVYQSVAPALQQGIARAIPEIIRSLGLKTQEIPPVTFTSDRSWAKDHNTFGVTQWKSSPEDSKVYVYVGDRYLADILRTYTHELQHVKQFLNGVAHHKMNKQEHDHVEADANTVAGRVIHNYGKRNNKIFTDVNESAEQLDEWSTTDARIIRYLTKRGYRKIGKGVDQTAFIEPGTGAVLKVFGTQCNSKQGEPVLSRDQEMFLHLTQFCEANSKNPYLPKIFGYETFIFKTKKRVHKKTVEEKCLYLQIRQEQLQPIRDRKLMQLLMNMSDSVEDNMSWENYKDDAENYSYPSADTFRRLSNNPASLKRLQHLYKTMQELYRIAEENNYTYDIHDANIMQRSDGTPVLVDPWVYPEGTEYAENAELDEVIQAPISKEKKAEEEYLKFIMAKVNTGRLLNRHEQQYLKDLQSNKKLAEDEDLDEVKMSPSALEKFVTSDAAKGIRAGFEAELIFRDTQGDSDEEEAEPDYDADERCYSIQQVIDFFSNDEYGYGLSDRQRNRLEENLDESYMNWRDEKILEDFRNDAEDLIRDRLLEETPMSQRIHYYLTDSLQKSDEDADRIVKAGADAPRFTKNADQEAYATENPDYELYLEAADAADEELEESVEFSINSQDEYWDEALDAYRYDWSGDDDSFFSDVGLRWMSDVANEYSLEWPVWNVGNQNYGSRSWESIADSLNDAIDMKVRSSSGYHSMARRPDTWIIEPDGSLEPDDKSEEVGLEIVSPPMPLLTTIEKLKQVVDWANDPNGGNAYTNSSTGLHMGVSLPFKGGDVDYVKLILFLGDKYVQKQFGREANTYCASALDKLKQNIKGKRSDPAGVIKLLQHGLTELAHNELQKGVGTSKYTSAHIQPGYIEFRSPGGDWLAEADVEIGILENTLMRFARAMQIAGDPSAERQEYAKKLYKLVTEDNPEYADQLRLFSEFSAGTIDKEQLKKQWADSVLQKELPSTGKNEYEVYPRDNANSPDAIVGTLYARDYDDAYNQFIRQYGKDINDLYVRIKQPWFDVFDETGKIVKTIRSKDVDTATGRAQYEFGERWTDDWKIYRRPDDTPEPKASPRAQVAKRIVTKPKTTAVGDGEASDWEAVYKPTGRVFDTLSHADAEQALAWRDSVMRSHGFTDVRDILIRRAGQEQAADASRDSQQLQARLNVPQPAATQNQSSQGSFTGQWQVRDSDTGDVLYTFGGVGNSQADANRVAAQWIRNNAPEADMWEYEVVPEIR